MDSTTFTSDELTPDDVAGALAGAGFEIGRAQKVRRSLLDTFDGRLHAAGSVSSPAPSRRSSWWQKAPS